ncbi:hypothetical protein OG339_32570 [Streptosporangium sp. NBC_01495]|uniref:hypothetical protein n=1 Tax=Streptosporangium sp. NBC_01495 TaxID=2903899 RepID=UPI002E35115B|nr:hypothetical protein [Streptosporangium sp. NBC_01495]
MRAPVHEPRGEKEAPADRANRDARSHRWRHLAILIIMVVGVTSLSVPGTLAAPTPPGTGAPMAPGPSPTVSGRFTVLLPPGTTAEDDQAAEKAARELLENPAGRELVKADREFVKPTKPQLPGSVGNVSVEWFDLGWMKHADDLPDWLKPEDLLTRLLEARETPADTDRYKTATKIVKHEGNQELHQQIGATPSSLLLQVSTSSEYRTRHSEIIPLDWLGYVVPLILQRMAKAGDVYIASKKAGSLSERILRESPLYIASQRTPCLDACDEETEAFPHGLAIAYYGTNNSEHAQRAKLLVPKVMQKAEAALRRQESDQAWRRRQANLGFCDGVGAPPGHREAGRGKVLAMAAPLPATPCAGGEPGGVTGALLADDYGGVDFSTLELRYMSDRPHSGDVRYSFSARPAAPGLRQSPESRLQAATDATADLRTWLVLNPNLFWVNLHPTQPDRIIDPELGRTKAGRAMLEADLQMKRTEGKLLNPNSKFGAKYWKAALSRGVDRACFSARMWIVPGRVEVHEDEDSLYVLKAPLAVKLKAEDIGGSYSCPSPNQAADARNEELHRSTVLPKIVKAVNTAPEYAPLRRAFTARVIAQWIRERHRKGHRTSFDRLIDSGNIGGAKLTDDWRPRQVFDAYLRSIRDGEFSVKRTVRKKGAVFIYQMRFGGVDFSDVPMTAVGVAEMGRRHPRLTQTVEASVKHPEKGMDGSTWLGEAGGPPPPGPWLRITDGIGGLVEGRVGVLALILVALGAIVFGFRGGSARRRRPTP